MAVQDAPDFPAATFMVAATPALCATGDLAWDRAIAEWLRLDALAHADHKFGPSAEADAEWMSKRRSLEERFGSRFPENPQCRPEFDEAFAVITAAEESRHRDYLKPMWEASHALLRTPAPNLAAGLFKLAMIERVGLDEFEMMEFVSADLRRGAAVQIAAS